MVTSVKTLPPVRAARRAATSLNSIPPGKKTAEILLSDTSFSNTSAHCLPSGSTSVSPSWVRTQRGRERLSPFHGQQLQISSGSSGVEEKAAAALMARRFFSFTGWKSPKITAAVFIIPSLPVQTKFFPAASLPALLQSPGAWSRFWYCPLCKYSPVQNNQRQPLFPEAAAAPRCGF